jgi:hypothetical protein
MPADFWTFQAKDAVTGAIALLGLVIAVTNLYNSYLRRPKLISAPANRISLASYYGEEAKFRIFTNCLFYNKGAEPAVIISLALRLIPNRAASSSSNEVVFQWHEFVAREEVRDTGAMYPKAIRASFEGEAFALIVPRTDAVEKEIVFIPVDNKPGQLIAGDYTLVLEGTFIGHGRRPRQFQSSRARLELSLQHFALVKERVVRDSEGKYLYSNHVRIRCVPDLGVNA